jgi:hypothetical protein
MVLFIAGTALAQDEGAAATLYNRGLDEMKAGKFEVACPALAESFRLDPRPGALFTLATCEARWGRLATAVARYDEYLGLFGRLTPEEQAAQRGRDEVAKEEKAALLPQVPQLTLVLPKSAPPGTIVKRDGVELSAVSLGVAFPVNPGERLIVTQVPGGAPHEQRVTLEKGEKKSVELEIVAAATANTAAPTATVSAKPPPSPPSTLRTAGFIAGGVGVAGVAAGAIVGALLFEKKATITSHCQGLVCDREGKEAADSARTLGLVSEISFAAGGAALVGGALLVILAPRAPKPTNKGAVWRPLVTTDGATGAVLGVEGAF